MKYGDIENVDRDAKTLMEASKDFQDGKRDAATMGRISLAMDAAKDAINKATKG